MTHLTVMFCVGGNATLRHEALLELIRVIASNTDSVWTSCTLFLARGVARLAPGVGVCHMDSSQERVDIPAYGRLTGVS